VRWLPAAVLLLLTLLGQATLAPHLAVAAAVPDFVLTGAVLAGLAAGPATGALYGLAAGLCLDLWRGRSVGLFGLAFAAAGWLGGQVGERVYPGRALVRFLALGLVTLAAQAIVLGLYHLGQGRVAWHEAGRLALGQAVYDGVLGVVGYRPFTRLRRRSAA
jgi:rod shape-determining protein MreD